MNLLRLGFLLLLFCFPSFGQSNAKLDSLKIVLAKLPPEGKAFASDTMRVRVLCEMGRNSSDSASIFSNLYSALRISKLRSWDNGKVLSQNYLGHKLLQGNFTYQAIDALNASLQISETTKDELQIAFSHKYLGACYYSLSEHDMAVKYYEKAANFYKNIDLKQYCTLLNNVGLSNIEQGQYQEAIKLYESIIEIYKKENDSVPLSWFYSNLGSAQQKAGLLEASVMSFDKSISNTPDLTGSVFAMSEKAISLLKLKKYSEAKTLILQAKQNSVDATTFQKIYIFKNAYLILNETAEDKEILEAYEDWIGLKDKNDADIKKKSIEGLKMFYENKNKANEINIEKNKIKYLLFSILALSIVVGLVFYNSRQMSKSKKKIEIQNAVIHDLNQNLELKVSERTEELKFANKELVLKNFEITEALYKGQTIERKRVAAELHDNLGSTLSALKWRLGALDSDNLNTKEKAIYESIRGMMSNAYEDVRNISHNLLPAEFETKGLVRALQKYIQDLNENSKIKFTFKTEGDLENIDKKVALELYSISMELITNILKHSMATDAKVYLKNISGKIYLEISDNGIGLKTNAKLGKGLVSIEDRVRFIGGTFKLSSEINKLNFTIIIPII